MKRKPARPKGKKSASRRLLKEREYAAFINKSVDQVRRERRRGAGPPFILVGQSVRYAPEQIEKFLTDHIGQPPKRRSRPLVSVSP